MLCPLPRMQFGDVYNGMTEQERAAALVARSRRMSRHRRRRTQRSGSGVSGTSVADSVGSRRGSTPGLFDFRRSGERQIRMLLAYAGRGIGTYTNSHTHTHTHTIKPPTADVQQVGHNSISICLCIHYSVSS